MEHQTDRCDENAVTKHYLIGGLALIAAVIAFCLLPTAWTIAALMLAIIIMPAVMLVQPASVSVGSGELSG